MSWTSPPGAWGAADPLFLLLIALGVEAYLGGRRLGAGWRWNPRRLVARLCLEVARRLNRPERPAASRRRRGALVAGSLALGALVLGWLAALFTRHYPFAWTLELFLLILLIDQRATWRLGAELQEALASGSLVRAREALRPLVAESLAPDEVDRLDKAQIVEAALLALGRRFAERALAPVLWYVVLGLPGLFMQQTAFIMAAVLGTQPQTGAYGEPARSLARAVAYVPDLVAALLLSLAAVFVPGGQSWSAMHRAMTSGNPGGAVLALVLGRVALSARLNRALVVFAVAALIAAALIAALALARLAV